MNNYVSPFSERYPSKAMQYLFSPDKKFRTWRLLWIALAEAEMELGLPITQEQIDELKAHAEDIDYEAAMQTRQEVRENLLEQLAAKRAGAPAAEVTALAGVPADSRPVLMAVAAKNGVVGEHFGHAREFLVYEASPKGVRLISLI